MKITSKRALHRAVLWLTTSLVILAAFLPMLSAAAPPRLDAELLGGTVQRAGATTFCSVNWGAAPLASVNWGWVPPQSVNWG